MTTLGVKLVSIVKDTTSFLFIIEDHNVKKILTNDNTVATQSYRMRSHFTCHKKMGNTKMKITVFQDRTI